MKRIEKPMALSRNPGTRDKGRGTRKLRLLFATSEAHPLVKTGGLAEVSGALPAALAARGVDARILVPGYPPVLDGVTLRTALRDIVLLPGLAPVRLLRGRMPDSGLPLYVLEAPSLYDRDGGPYQDPAGDDWPDNALRFGALSRMAALLGAGSLPLGWHANVIHANDWQTGLVPAYLHYQPGVRPRTVMSVHNMAFPGAFAPAVLPALGLPPESFAMYGLEFHGNVSFLKAGLYYADHLATVSPGYAREIQTAEYGCGLEGLLRTRHASLTGILNGIDTQRWDPSADPHLFRRYSAEHPGGKAINKRGLQERLGLEPDPDVPLVGMVTRLTWQKGSDLVAAALPGFAGERMQWAVLGSGEPAIEASLRRAAAREPGRTSVTVGFDEELAHQIEAGADLFLMPSRFEPCGLNQMYSMRYGTLPLVRRTGGLADSVVDTVPETVRAGNATGFVFNRADAVELEACLRRALALHPDRRTWRRVQRNGMLRDFSWDRSAEEYLEVYRRLVGTGASET